MQRSGYYRGLYLTACLEFLGFKVINRFEVGQMWETNLSHRLASLQKIKFQPQRHSLHLAESGLENIKKTGFPVI